MSSPPDAALTPAVEAGELEGRPPAPARNARLLNGLGYARERVSLWHAGLVAVLALSAVLEVRRLRQNGFANIFYSAGVKSELASWHNFLFVSFDPGGLISVDKPPLGMWLQVASARVFGFSPLSVLLPEAIVCVLAVGVMFAVVSRRFGLAAGVTSALVLAVFPSFVAISRDNGPDSLLILLMLLACGAGLRAVETGRWRWLLASAVLVGLAFNTKTLAALLVVPGIALAYLVCAESALPRRLVELIVAGLVLAVVAGAWIEFVDLTPASQRPFVGSSTDNTEFNLTFDYNGFGRVGGQVGGPGRVPVIPVLPFRASPSPASGARAPRPHPTTASRTALPAIGASTSRPQRHVHRAPTPAPSPAVAARRAAAHARAVRAATVGVEPIPHHGHAREPTAFAGPTGPLRLFDTSLGGQGGWLLPFAVIGMLAIAATVRGRRDRRLAGLIVLGGWFVCEAALLSFSKGIVHPYYVAELGPGLAAMAGAGAWAMVDLTRRIDWRGAVLPTLTGLLLPALAVAGTVLAEYVLLRREHYLHAFVPVLIGGAALGVLLLIALKRWAAPFMALVVALLLVAPTAYATTVWEVPTNGTFPAAGPHAAGGPGGLGTSGRSYKADTRLYRYVLAHRPGTRWDVLTVASDTSASLILMGLKAGAMAGYSGTDPALDGAGLAHLVRTGEARYVLLGGAYADRGGNAASHAVPRDCAMVPSEIWRGTRGGGENALALFDCRGREAQLTASG